MPTLDELRAIRIQKLKTLRKIGISPYPSRSKKDIVNNQIVQNFYSFQGKMVSLTGRLMAIREHGRVVFADIQDESGTIQLFIRADRLEKTDVKRQILGFSELSLIDIGDFIEAYGEVTKTSSGEISLLVHSLKLLTKSLRPLPDKHDGLKDPEIIFRRRYVDLTINPDHRALFRRKSKFWESIRKYLKNQGFLEVETPVLEHVTGGADARPFVTYMNALGQNFYLRISTELYQKRLIGGGFEKIFTLGPNFRNEGISDEHLPEYYQVEWYWAYADYRDNMRLVQDLMRSVAIDVWGTTRFEKDGHAFDLASEWKEIDYAEVIRGHFGIDIFVDTEERMIDVLKKQGVHLEGSLNKSRLIDNLWKVIRKTIAGPAFLVNEPTFMSPLAKSNPDNPKVTERFHVIIAGSELGNGYSELNDPLDQFERFKEQQQARDKGDEEAQMMDIDFVEMLEYGMPPTSGYGQSERVFWFLEGVTAREGTLFPHLRTHISDETKRIYGISLPSKQPNVKESEHNITPLSRQQAIDLLHAHMKNENLRRHCYAVGYAMRALAEKLGGNPDLWEVLGILHDADWEETKDMPDQHTRRTLEWLCEKGITNGPLVRALQSHNRKLTKLAEIDGIMEWALETCDELTGFIIAVTLVQPDKKLSSVTVDSVVKKWKAKEFAKNVDRKQIEQCEDQLGIQLNDFIAVVLASMQNHAEELGL
ncbi:MAG: lysine--tRNA ligase [Patescibacteria group bacterium]|nr:lysine--tRNA ligase [Patescibacteria group bacterium]